MVQHVTLYSNNILGKSVLMYGYTILKSKAKNTEFLHDDDIPIFEYIPREKRMKLKIIILGAGTHTIPWNGHTIVMRVENTLEGEVVSSMREMEFLKVITISMVGSEDNEAALNEFIMTAKDYVEKYLDTFRKQKNKVKRYIFDEKNHDWEILNVGPQRSFDTIFMNPRTKEKLIECIRDFTSDDVKNEYARFSIPYKFNILLHGAPGTGKSSTISAIASEIDSDVAIVHFTPTLNDNKLIRAVNHISSLDKCKIIVMEDIDSLFVDRKENDTNKNSVTLSGLLNALDGLSRVEGVIVILTTNNIDAIDHAMLRPGRMDYIIKYEYVTKEIAKTMFDYYLPDCEDLFDAYFKAIECHRVTPSMLQQFFFRHRKAPREILRNIDEMHEIIRDKGYKRNFALGGKSDDSETSNMYM